MSTTGNGFADDIAVAFNVDGVAQCVVVAAGRTAEVDAFGDSRSVVGYVLVGCVQLAAVDSIFAVGVDVAIRYVGYFVACIVQTVFSQVYLTCFQAVFVQCNIITNFHTIIINSSITGFHAVNVQVFIGSNFINSLTFITCFFSHNDVLTLNDFSFRCRRSLFQLRNINRIGVIRTGRNVGNLVAAIVQASFGQVHIACFQAVFVQCNIIADFYTVIIHHGITCGNAVNFQVFIGSHFVNGLAIGADILSNNNVIALNDFGLSRSRSFVQLSNIDRISVIRTGRNIGNLVAAVVQAGFSQIDIANFHAVSIDGGITGFHAVNCQVFSQFDFQLIRAICYNTDIAV